MIPEFRVWDKQKEEFVEDVFIKGNGVVHVLEEECGCGSLYCSECRKLSIKPLYDDSNFIFSFFTGQLDKSKQPKEIFDGDIIKFIDSWAEYDIEGYVDGETTGINHAEIIKTVDGWGFGRTKFADSSLDFWTDVEHFKFSEIIDSEDLAIEVIGNIYENPELIKETPWQN